MNNFFSKCDQDPQFPADLVTFTEEILNGKLHFFPVRGFSSSQFRRFQSLPDVVLFIQ